MLEKNIEKKCCDYAKKNGYFVQKVQFISQKGCPDRLFYKDEDIFFVEFKTKSGKLSKLQEIQIDRLKNAIDVFVINDVDCFKTLLDGRIQKNKG